jgi:molybdopterin converting factor small subunit
LGEKLVEITLIANLIEKVGSEKINVKAEKLSEALKFLIPKLPDILDLEGKPSGNYIFLLNGADYRVFGDDPVVKDSDKVTIIPVSHGG